MITTENVLKFFFDEVKKRKIIERGSSKSITIPSKFLKKTGIKKGDKIIICYNEKMLLLFPNQELFDFFVSDLKEILMKSDKQAIFSIISSSNPRLDKK